LIIFDMPNSIHSTSLSRAPLSTLSHRWSSALHTLFALCTACVIASPAVGWAQAQKLPTTTLYAGMYLIKAEAAVNEEQREIGLMNRRSLGVNEGMIFRFDNPAGVCMWMKNTLIPLSVAFMDGDGKILNIEEMKAQTLDSHCAVGAATYALEMNEKWFSQHHITPGVKITGLPLSH
jgi:uncharacterized membrane protein (UPF0127 family)